MGAEQGRPPPNLRVVWSADMEVARRPRRQLACRFEDPTACLAFLTTFCRTLCGYGRATMWILTWPLSAL